MTHQHARLATRLNPLFSLPGFIAMSRFLLLVVLGAFLLVDVRGEEDSEWTQCSNDCVCSETSENLTAAICSFPVLLDGRCNESLLDIPEDTLDVL